MTTSSLALAALPVVRTLAPIAEARQQPFQHGVASGDPLADGVMLWTRVSGATAPVDVSWVVARNAALSQVVARGATPTGAERDHTVKIDVRGLAPGMTYYYRFEARGAQSPVGRTRTLPAGAVDRVRLGVASCANLPFGYFNAYRRMAERSDLDAVVHLGDYFYEYRNGEYGDGTKLGRVPAPDKEVIALADYRGRHAQYKADPDLQEVHRQHPFVVVWDDHEFANNAWSGGAQNHNPDKSEGEWYARRNAAKQAFYEWMPIREDAQSRGARIYRTISFGTLADLIMLDTRLVGRFQQVARDAIALIESPDRSLLGAAQENWLHDELRESTRANVAWQVLGQQVMFAPQVAAGRPAANADSWDGYRASRERVFDMVEQVKAQNFAVLTGDVHSNWAYDLPRRVDGYDAATGRGSLGVEIVGTSITSPSNVGVGPEGQKRLAETMAARPHLRYADGRHRGYVVVDLTRKRLQADFYEVPTIIDRTKDERFAKGFVAEAGRMHLVEVTSPAAAKSSSDPAP